MESVSAFEDPRTAIIRLLRGLGECQCASPPSGYERDDQLWRSQQELQAKIAEQKQKLLQIPCILVLAEEIDELKEVTQGLAHENYARMNEIRMGGRNTNAWQQEDSLQTQRLQGEYVQIMKSLELTNDQNQILVNALASQH